MQRRRAEGGEQGQSGGQPGDLIADEAAVQTAQPSGAGRQHPAQPARPPVQGDARHGQRDQYLAQIGEHAARRRGGGRATAGPRGGMGLPWVPSTPAA